MFSRTRIHSHRSSFGRLAGASSASVYSRALAQSGSNYRALVCVFLYGGNDSNNTIIPMDDTNYKAYQSIRGKPGTERQRSDADGDQRYRRAVRRSTRRWRKWPACFRATNWRWWPTSARWCSRSRARSIRRRRPRIPLNLFSHSDQQLQWQTSIAQGHSPTGWAGRAADYIASQNLNSSSFPPFLLGRRQFPGRDRRRDAARGARSRPIDALSGFNTPPLQARQRAQQSADARRAE